MERPQRVILEQKGHAGALRDTAVSHIAFRVPAVAEAVRFYTRVLGMVPAGNAPEGGARLGWGAGHHVIDLYEGDQGLVHYGFEVRDPGGVAAIRQRLEQAGSEVRGLNAACIDFPDGPVDGLTVTDPDGTEVHFHSRVYRHGEALADPGRRPIKFQHTTLGTAAIGPMIDFFVGVIGFRISDQLADGAFAWLRSDRDHHTLAVVVTGHGGDIDHYSYDLAEWADFKVWCDRLTELDVPVQWGPGRHGPGNNLFTFFDDPAGNHIELSAEMEKFHDDRVEYVPRRWTPAPTTVNLWGGQTPKWRRLSETSI